MKSDNGIKGIFKRRNKAGLYLLYVYGYESLKDQMETKHLYPLRMNFMQVLPNAHGELRCRNSYYGSHKLVYFSTKKAIF